MNYDTSFRIGDHEISASAPSYFVADIAANHDGDLDRAKALIFLAKEAGAEPAAPLERCALDAQASRRLGAGWRTRRPGDAQ